MAEGEALGLNSNPGGDPQAAEDKRQLAGNVQDPDTRQYYYLARVELARQYVDQRNKKFPIQVGMPLVADIKGQRKSVLRYLFQPFTRTMDSALRESR